MTIGLSELCLSFVAVAAFTGHIVTLKDVTSDKPQTAAAAAVLFISKIFLYRHVQKVLTLRNNKFIRPVWSRQKC